RSYCLLLVVLLCAPNPAVAVDIVEANLGKTTQPLVAKRRKRRSKRRRKVSKPPKTETKKPIKPEPKATPVPPKVEPKTRESAVLESAEKPGLAVMAMDAQIGLPAGVANLLNETLLAQIHDTDRFGSVLSSSDMQAMLDLESQKAAMGCDQDSCMAELGGALGVPYMLIPSVAAFGGRFIINMKLVAVEESRVAARISKTVTSEGALLDALPLAVGELFNKAFGAPAAAAPAETAVQSPAAPVISSAATEPAKTTNWLLWGGLSLSVSGAALTALTGPFSSNRELVGARQDYEAYTGDNAEQWDLLAKPLSDARDMGIVGGSVVALGLGLTVYSLMGGAK
ncbi:MAG: hypothetical protein OSB21_12735, partial [Myxococcota bacterium]|nr:hypothetical protein [Myxococcota bacterium]